MKLRDLLEKIDDPKLAYHDELNPKIWTNDDGKYTLKLEVKKKLISIGDEFVDSLGINKDQVKDYVFTGSNANYNWTSLSDVDLHVILDMKAVCDNCKSIDAKDCFDAKKSLWNDRHDIKIFGFPVELYASDMKERIVGDAGVYSLLENKWLRNPERKNVKMDSRAIKAKADDIAHAIDDLIDSKTDDRDTIKDLTNKIANYRKAGLAKGGEFSIENLVFKALRNNGYIDKIRKYAVKAQDHTLSLEEALNTPINVDVDVDQDDCYIASSKINDSNIKFTAVRKSIPVNGKYIWEIVFSDDHSGFDLSGKGNEFKVFSMVKQCFEHLIKKHSPDVIKFSASKQDKSRAKVYETLINKFLRGYSIKKYEDPKQIKFKLDRS